MATKLLKSWIQNIWNKFNSVITSYSDGLSTLSNFQGKVTASDFNTTLSNKIAQMKSDYYLKHEASLFTAYTITKNTKVVDSARTNYENEVNGFSVLVCKNTMSYTNGTTACSNGSNSNQICDRGTYNRGHNDDYCNSIVQESRSSNSNGSYEDYYTCTQGTKTNATTCTNEYTVNLRCAKTTGTK